MSDQVYWEDVSEGMELPSLVNETTTRQLVQYAGASGDFYEIHYDKDFATDTGLPGVIIHGALKNAFLGYLMTDWAGESGWLRKLSCQYRGMDYPGIPLTAKGVITRKYQDGEALLVDCDIRLENPEGEINTPGTATVELPSRNNL